jgi:large subunit ribosomal protein L13
LNFQLNITNPTTAKEIKRSWHLVDVAGVPIGRVCPKIANLLMGKAKPYFARNMDCGDFVVVINSAKIKATGKKENQKMYRKHSGYPGGFKEISLGNLRAKNSNVIVSHAVSHMVPDNKLKKKAMSRLYIYANDKHPYGDKFRK